MRFGWALLAGFVSVIAAVAAAVGVVPMYRYTSCEVLGGGEHCTSSSVPQQGQVQLALLAAAVVLCLVPVAFPRRFVAWAVVVLLGAGGIVAVIVSGTTGVALLIVAVLAAAVTAARHRHTSSSSSR